MDEALRIFKNQLLQSCSYIIDGYELWMIDCGDAEPIIDYIKKSGKTLRGVLLTHCHQDHIYGLCELLKNYPHTKIYCSQLTAQGLHDDKMNLSYLVPECSFKFEHEENVVVINQGKQTIDRLEIEILPTPGHSDDCMTYIIGNRIFTGDSYIPFAKVFAKWPRSNKQIALGREQNLKKVIEERGLEVFCGHWR